MVPQLILDTVRVLLALMALATLAITPVLMRASVDDGQRGRFWGSTALLVSVVISNAQNFGTPMRWAFPIVIVGVLSITYGSFHMYRRLRAERRDS